MVTGAKPAVEASATEELTCRVANFFDGLLFWDGPELSADGRTDCCGRRCSEAFPKESGSGRGTCVSSGGVTSGRVESAGCMSVIELGRWQSR
jgi:hypothetical protein